MVSSWSHGGERRDTPQQRASWRGLLIHITIKTPNETDGTNGPKDRTSRTHATEEIWADDTVQSIDDREGVVDGTCEFDDGLSVFAQMARRDLVVYALETRPYAEAGRSRDIHLEQRPVTAVSGPYLLIIRLGFSGGKQDDEVVQIVLDTSSPTRNGSGAKTRKQLPGGLLLAGGSQTRPLATAFVCRVCGAFPGSMYFRCARRER